MKHTEQEINKIAKFIDESINYLVEEDVGCAIYKLDDKIGVIVGWMPGYDTNREDGDIHSKEAPSYCINVGLGVYTSDYMKTDMEYINQPYREDTGDVWDTQYTVNANYDLNSLKEDVSWLLEEYDKMCEYNIDTDGKILGSKIEDDSVYVCDESDFGL